MNQRIKIKHLKNMSSLNSQQFNREERRISNEILSKKQYQKYKSPSLLIWLIQKQVNKTFSQIFLKLTVYKNKDNTKISVMRYLFSILQSTMHKNLIVSFNKCKTKSNHLKSLDKLCNLFQQLFLKKQRDSFLVLLQMSYDKGSKIKILKTQKPNQIIKNKHINQRTFKNYKILKEDTNNFSIKEYLSTKDIRSQKEQEEIKQINLDFQQIENLLSTRRMHQVQKVVSESIQKYENNQDNDLIIKSFKLMLNIVEEYLRDEESNLLSLSFIQQAIKSKQYHTNEQYWNDFANKISQKAYFSKILINILQKHQKQIQHKIKDQRKMNQKSIKSYERQLQKLNTIIFQYQKKQKANSIQIVSQQQNLSSIKKSSKRSKSVTSHKSLKSVANPQKLNNLNESINKFAQEQKKMLLKIEQIEKQKVTLDANLIKLTQQCRKNEQKNKQMKNMQQNLLFENIRLTKQLEISNFKLCLKQQDYKKMYQKYNKQIRQKDEIINLNKINYEKLNDQIIILKNERDAIKLLPHGNNQKSTNVYENQARVKVLKLTCQINQKNMEIQKCQQILIHKERQINQEKVVNLFLQRQIQNQKSYSNNLSVKIRKLQNAKNQLFKQNQIYKKSNYELKQSIISIFLTNDQIGLKQKTLIRQIINRNVEQLSNNLKYLDRRLQRERKTQISQKYPTKNGQQSMIKINEQKQQLMMKKQYLQKKCFLYQNLPAYNINSRELIECLTIFEQKLKQLMHYLENQRILTPFSQFHKFITKSKYYLSKLDCSSYFSQWYEFMRKLFVQLKQGSQNTNKIITNQSVHLFFQQSISKYKKQEDIENYKQKQTSTQLTLSQYESNNNIFN